MTRTNKKKNRVVRIEITFNIIKDHDILEYLNKLDNKAGYIKNLVRDHIRFNINGYSKQSIKQSIKNEQKERSASFPELKHENIKLKQNVFSSKNMDI